MIFPKTSKTEVDRWVYQQVPRFLGYAMEKYFRLEVEGLDKLPQKGRALITPNHSGFLGLDALLLAHVISSRTPRVARILAHKAWFWTQLTAQPAQKLGLVKAHYEEGIRLLDKNRVVLVFPEGEQGNFKPSANMYELRPFHRGFVRMALASESPIIPTLVLGAEESNINLKQISLGLSKKRITLPLPLNFLPLPVKWKIKFLTPRYLPFPKSSADDRDLVNEIAEEIQASMQAELLSEIQKRRSVF